MLWTDGIYPTPADIQFLDPDLFNELSGDGLPTSILSLCGEAYSQCASILASKLQSVIGATNFNPSGGATALHNASVIWGVRAQSNVVRVRMGQVVMDDLYKGDGYSINNPVTINAPLKNWIICWAAVLGYRKLVGRQDPKNDRYRTKYNFYRGILGTEKWNLLKSTGLPYIRTPFPAPGALYESQSGVWSLANSISYSSTGSSTGGPFVVAITWVDQTSSVAYVSPTKKNNAESGPSMVYPIAPNTFGLLSVAIPPNNLLEINITSLIPPTGAVNNAEASITGVTQGTRIATGWNVYVGSTQTGYLYLQNANPIPVAQKTYTLAADPVLSGYIMSTGQYPEANMPLSDLMMRQ